MSDIAQNRTLEMVAAEIRTFSASMLNNIIEIGRRMCEAKDMLPYGDFGGWIKENTGYSSSTANNFMRLFHEYGALQGTLFGTELECQTFGKLNYTQALALLALPADEREEFVQENRAEEMSTRELQQAIRERDAARARMEELEAQVKSTMEDQGRKEAALLELQGSNNALQSALKKADIEQGVLRKQVEELENRPVEVAMREATPEEISAAVTEALAAERKKHAKETEEMAKSLLVAEKEYSDLKKAVDEAEERAVGAEKANTDDAQELRQEVMVLRKQLQMADPVVAEFKGLFEQASVMVSRMQNLILLAQEDTQNKLKAALVALGDEMRG